MSADNWDICPRCNAAAKAEHDAAFQKAVDAYGKVPAEEYERLRAEASKLVELEAGMREDYELGTTEDGRFYIHYSASCQACGFKHTFEHEEQLQVVLPL